MEIQQLRVSEKVHEELAASPELIEQFSRVVIIMAYGYG
jgi:hypothetical protein